MKSATPYPFYPYHCECAQECRLKVPTCSPSALDDAFSVTFNCPPCLWHFEAFSIQQCHVPSDRSGFLFITAVHFQVRGSIFLLMPNYSWKAGVGMKNFGQHLSLAQYHSLFVSGRAHQRRWGILIWKVFWKMALWSVTLNLLSLIVLAGAGECHLPLHHLRC